MRAWSVCLIIRAEENCDLCFWCKKPCGGNHDWPINTAIKLNLISTWSKILRVYCLHNNSIWPLLIMLCRCIIPVSSLYQVFFVFYSLALPFRFCSCCSIYHIATVSKLESRKVSWCQTRDFCSMRTSSYPWFVKTQKSDEICAFSKSECFHCRVKCPSTKC